MNKIIRVKKCAAIKFNSSFSHAQRACQCDFIKGNGSFNSKIRDTDSRNYKN